MPYPLGLQLYSLHREHGENLESLLELTCKLGFHAAEMSGRYKNTSEEWRRCLSKYQITLLGAHVSCADLEADLVGEIEFQRSVGNTRLIIPSIPESRRHLQGYRETARRLNELGTTLQTAGMELLYHNHGYDFDRLPESWRGIDILLAETDPERVRFEIDTYWVERGGLNSRDFIMANADRIGMLHAREFRRKDQRSVAAGQGDVDFRSLTALARKNRWPVILEYEGERTAEMLAASARYLQPLVERP